MLLKACLDLKMEYPFTIEGFRDIRSAHRFASRIKHEKLNANFSQFIAEMDKIHPDITLRASKEDIDDLVIGANPDPRILLSLPQAFYHLLETIKKDWDSDQSIHESAIAIATSGCSLEAVDDDTFYTWLAKKIDEIADYDERAGVASSFVFGQSHLAQLGHRFLRLTGASRVTSGDGTLQFYRNVLHDAQGQQFVHARYRDAWQIWDRDMAVLLGEWRSDEPTRNVVKLSRH